MKKNLKNVMLWVALMATPLTMFAQNTDGVDTVWADLRNASYHTEYMDGKKVQIYSDSILGLAVTNTLLKDDYGAFYQLHITVANNMNESFDFDPSLIQSVIVDKEGEKNSLLVYTAESFMRKVKRQQKFNMLMYGFALGMESAGASNMTSSYISTYNGYGYTQTISNYNPTAVYLSNMAASNTLVNLDDRFKNDREVRNMEYLKLNTLHSGDIISGLVNIKRKKGKDLFVYIPAKGKVYIFVFPVDKKKE